MAHGYILFTLFTLSPELQTVTLSSKMFSRKNAKLISLLKSGDVLVLFTLSL